MERIPIEDDLLMCPYEECHQIMRSLMSLHLLRCRRHHRFTNLVQCPLNNAHIIPEPELDWHVQDCPSRKGFEHFIHCEKNSQLNVTKEEPLVCKSSTEGDDCESDWDSLPPAPTYNPLKNIALKNVIRHPVGMTPSERVAFRVSERRRLRNLRDVLPQ